MRTRLVILTLCLSLALAAFADVPPMINYQGKLLTPAGAAVADTAYVMQFAIYDAPVAGTQLWSEPPSTVQVKKGLFSVLLGSVNNLGPNLFSAPNRFLGVKVGADAEMTPRQQIVSSAFAFKAATADMAATAVNALMANTVPDGAITTSKLAAGAVTQSNLSNDINPIKQQLVHRRIIFGIAGDSPVNYNGTWTTVVYPLYGLFGYAMPQVQQGATRKYRLYAVYSDTMSTTGTNEVMFHCTDYGPFSDIIISLPRTWGDTSGRRDAYSDWFTFTETDGHAQASIHTTTGDAGCLRYLELQAWDFFN